MTRAAAVIGASGGIGAALVGALRDEGAYDVVHAVSRGGDPRLDFDDEDSIRDAAARIAAGPPLDDRGANRTGFGRRWGWLLAACEQHCNGQHGTWDLQGHQSLSSLRDLSGASLFNLVLTM